ncbi:bromodomain-containing protein DDB_G0270170 [Frieseomelitta varia]|uniref:bromodomain-containing protein DDB_G0270170 n=1 Tax=Frieseomelitta varia TaxID=561572 RepID=UPI001CB67909|nr:bromodomain-containing protein DDB_G0270170 [Frieseomelitta varia]XP_043511157.1 bromodomain-containing protein DDB_G0270170 [Frieseomelitta varia]XP_043511158.1 bromodomain-containing protein DDB_G0270170 [Frieseomelitta varia]
MAEKCKECGCKCVSCNQNDQQHGEMHLHVEIENLRQRLMERDNHIVTMETQFLNEADKFPNGELASMKEEILIWQEKYSRLYEAHKRVQKVNQNLEDKLLRIVDKCETEKSAFTKDIATLSHRLADANYTIHRLTQDNEKYRNDVNLAIQLLQCKPSNFVGQKYDSLPSEVQAKVRTYIAQKKHSNDTAPADVKSITVPISTFPPTAMVYNVTKSTENNSDDDTDDSKPPVDVVSAAIMAKVLEDREKERVFGKHCDTCTCHKSILMVDAETQTNTPVFFCNECTMKYAQNVEKQSDNLKNIDKNCQNKGSQNSLVHVVYHEGNESVSSKIHQNNCTKNGNHQLCTRDKFLSRNFNKKNSIRRSDPQHQSVFQNQSENMSKQTIPYKINDTCLNSKINVDKGKQTKLNKKYELQIDGKFSSNSWNKSSNCNHIVPENCKNYFDKKEPSHVDIINDRLWKNEWTKLKSQTKTKENKDKVNSDIEIDIINDRAWKNDRSTQDTHHPTQLTLIEVKNIDNVAHQNDSGQIEIATSPSFSSDSIVISTSDPSSSSSDVVQLTGMRLHNNASNLKSNTQNRITGPRNCLVRVTSGSKNILLDNAGHYKTVLYTSGNNKPNTALVHSKKLSRSGSERSISTSSEENTPMLLHDNNQLQRVAEWVQSSVHMDSSRSNYTELKPNENIIEKSLSLTYLEESQTKSKLVENNRELYEDSSKNKCKNLAVDVQEFKGGNLNNDVNNFSLNVNNTDVEKEKDLISFDVPTEEENVLPKILKKPVTADFDYEVKITKEMEETYLKLAASLDPVALSLSSTDNADLTIEKYRKNHKRFQRSHDKTGSKV